MNNDREPGPSSDSRPTGTWATCPTCGEQYLVGYACVNCWEGSEEADRVHVAIGGTRPRRKDALGLNWAAIGTVGFFVLLFLNNDTNDPEGGFPYRLGLFFGSVVIGYGVYRLGRFIAHRGKDQLLTPITVQSPPEPWYKSVWLRGVAVLLILSVGVLGAVYPGGSFEDGFFQGLGDRYRDEGISETSLACIEEGLRRDGYVSDLKPLLETHTESQLVALFSSTATDPLADAPPEMRRLVEGLLRYTFDPVDGCLSPEEIETLAGIPRLGAPITYGSDPQRDALYDGCIEGTFVDCDMLWLVSDPGSEYEAVAETCGGRDEPASFDDPFCVILHDEVSAAIAASRRQCEEGFFPACGLLFALSEIGSPDDILASTCGHRREASDVLPCWIDLGLGSRVDS